MYKTNKQTNSNCSYNPDCPCYESVSSDTLKALKMPIACTNQSLCCT